MLRPRLLLSICLLSLVCSCVADASLILQETFVTGASNYTANGNLAGQNSVASQGFTGAWSGTTTSYATTLASPNLSMAGVTWNNGGSVRIQTNSDFYASREQDRTFTSSAGQSELWFGTLFQPSTNAFDAGRETMMAFLTDPLVNKGGGATSTTTPSHATAALWSNTNGVDRGGFAWGISTFGSTNNALTVKYQADLGGTDQVIAATTGINLTVGTTYLLIAQLLLNTAGVSDTLNVWAVTALPSSTAALGAPHWSVSADILATSASLDTLVFMEGTNLDTSPSVGLSYYDAIRMATTFDSLIAVPEPSRLLLLGMGSLVLLWQRRGPRIG